MVAQDSMELRGPPITYAQDSLLKGHNERCILREPVTMLSFPAGFLRGYKECERDKELPHAARQLL